MLAMFFGLKQLIKFYEILSGTQSPERESIWGNVQYMIIITLLYSTQTNKMKIGQEVLFPTISYL
jgi:hypothetical protein